MKSDCEKRGHDLYLAHNDEGKVIEKCMYCSYWKYALNIDRKKQKTKQKMV